MGANCRRGGGDGRRVVGDSGAMLSEHSQLPSIAWAQGESESIGPSYGEDGWSRFLGLAATLVLVGILFTICQTKIQIVAL